MNTNLILIIIAAVIVAIILAVKLFSKSKFQKILNEIAVGHGATVSKFDKSPRGLAMGITNDKKGFVYYKIDEDKTEHKTFVNLTEVSVVSVDQGGGKSSAGYGKICLVFNFNDKNKNDLALVFFNRGEFFQLADELELAEKWRNEINTILAGQNKKAVSATAV